MASTYSTNLKIELIGTGEQAGTWGTTTNTNLGTALEQAVVGKADVTMSSTTITLTLTNANTAQNARAIYLNLTGSPGGAAVLEVPAIQKPYIVKNGSDQQVTIKVSGQTGVAIPTGKTALVYNNGTDVVTAVDFIPEIATTTVDTTNIEVTNIKAKDGTSAGSIADSTGVVTLASSVLTTTDINGGTIDGAVIGGSTAAAGSFTTLNTSDAVVFNDAGADVDFRVEGDTDANLLFVDASADAVGIGTGAPNKMLDVAGNAEIGRGQIIADATVGNFAIYGGMVGNSTNSQLSFLGKSVSNTGLTYEIARISGASFGPYALDGGLQFSIASNNGSNVLTLAERMRIDSSGNVGIGTTTPSSFYSLADNLVIGTGSGSHGLTIYSGSGESGYIGFNDTVTNGMQGFIQYNHSGDYMAFAPNGSEKARITSDGYLRMASGSGGIQFNGDTAAANALDDYEEGTWTPGVSFGGASAGVTFSAANSGRYTKIGRSVTVIGLLQLTNKGSSTGSASITGLPFTVASGEPNYGGMDFGYVASMTFADVPFGRTAAGATELILSETTNAGVVTEITNSDFANDTIIRFTCTYFV
jgi:hypothetical protein